MFCSANFLLWCMYTLLVSVCTFVSWKGTQLPVSESLVPYGCMMLQEERAGVTRLLHVCIVIILSVCQWILGRLSQQSFPFCFSVCLPKRWLSVLCVRVCGWWHALLPPGKFSGKFSGQLQQLTEQHSFCHMQRQAGKFSEPRARFYFGEIILALDYLHSFGIVFRYWWNA